MEEEIDKLEKEIIALKKKIELYEISTKLDYEKIEKLKEENIKYKKIFQFIKK